MANEISVTVQLAGAKSFPSVSRGSATALQVNMTGERYIQKVQNVGNVEEALDMGDVSTPGWAYFKNLDATNYVEIRPATAAADCVRLNPGEACVFRFAADATAPFAIADTAAVDLEYIIFED